MAIDYQSEERLIKEILGRQYSVDLHSQGVFISDDNGTILSIFANWNAPRQKVEVDIGFHIEIVIARHITKNDAEEFYDYADAVNVTLENVELKEGKWDLYHKQEPAEKVVEFSFTQEINDFPEFLEQTPSEYVYKCAWLIKNSFNLSKLKTILTKLFV